MSTKKLAKELGLLRKRRSSVSDFRKTPVSNQIFSYLIVIDFESTCWREKNAHRQEIIEFPAVLLNTSTGEVESEFHSYVQPQERPTLSEFCTQLTGITQAQVEAAVPLHICLSRFSRWLQSLQMKTSLVFPNHPSPSAASQKRCAFLTWSDWDLGVCLQYECRRKQIHKPDVLNSWIDLRSTYRLFYDRKPKGLNGALQDLGIQFAGREHSGLDDARNTAQLAARMMRDGCVMKVTRSLSGAPSVVKRTSADTKKAIANPQMEQMAADGPDMQSDAAQGFLPACQSLVSPKTLLGGAADTGAVLVTNGAPPHKSSSSLVLCSTTASCLSTPDRLDRPPGGGEAPRLVAEEERAEVLHLETGERWGSYDEVVLDGDGDVVTGESGCNYTLDFHGDDYLWEEPEYSASVASSLDSTRERDEAALAPQRVASKNLSLAPKSGPSQANVCSSVTETWQQSRFIKPDPQASKPNRLRTGRQISTKAQEKPKLPQRNSGSTTRSSCARVCHLDQTPKSSFSIYPVRPSGGSFCTAKRVLASLSANVLDSKSDCSLKGVQKVTPPLCSCGRRSKRQVVSNGGPNQGRGFYCCAVRRWGGTGGIRKGCEFFKWESAVIKSSSVAAAAAAARSSVSLCQVNPQFNIWCEQSQYLRNRLVHKK